MISLILEIIIEIKLNLSSSLRANLESNCEKRTLNSIMKETEKNLALRVEDSDSADSFLVYGRGIYYRVEG